MEQSSFVVDNSSLSRDDNSIITNKITRRQGASVDRSGISAASKPPRKLEPIKNVPEISIVKGQLKSSTSREHIISRQNDRSSDSRLRSGEQQQLLAAKITPNQSMTSNQQAIGILRVPSQGKKNVYCCKQGNCLIF